LSHCFKVAVDPHVDMAGLEIVFETSIKCRASRVTNMEEVCRLLETLTIEIKAIGEQCVTQWAKTPGEKSPGRDGDKNGKLT